MASEPPPVEEPSVVIDRRSPSRSVTSERPDAAASNSAAVWSPEDPADESEQEDEHEPDEDELNMWMDSQIDLERLTLEELKSIKEMAHLGNTWTNRGQMDFVTWLL